MTAFCDLLLPGGDWALQFHTDRIIPVSQARNPWPWDGQGGLSGNGIRNVFKCSDGINTRQPNYGCPTGAEQVANQLLIQLARQYLPRRQEGDDDPRWSLLE